MKDPGPLAGRGKSYADADTIPKMAPSTERKGGSPTKKRRKFKFNFCSVYGPNNTSVHKTNEFNRIRIRLMHMK